MSGEPDVMDEELDSENSIDVSCDLDNVYRNLKDGIIGDDDVNLNCYLEAYKELYNFFVLLGGAFQFMATDVKSKIKILEDLQNEEKLETGEMKNFSTVKSMILYEKGEKLLENTKYVSGCRTLLRLHRGLDFVRKFFKELSTLDDNVKIGGVCRKTYDETLAAYHTWVVKNSARLVMKLLPTRESLLKKISRSDSETMTRVLTLMPDMLSTMETTYTIVQKLYKMHNLLELP